ncbi:hypothetical protein WR25_26812 [Diploscapter pachys]|uniref:Major facilitator superfamily (MFS) profile domain-containing protein n=1 Tax=Diploscapter pachys TaxID=2018661 RepID=A0A2A2KKM0_9BILA|nr:hypothetical protein WR25_26812 [Diploscapter pachys]
MKLDKSVSIDFLGWVAAACSLGQSLASPLFGYWNQRTHSIILPVIVGFLISTFGQIVYLLLPWFPVESAKWLMVFARFVTGIGTGTISVLRTYQSLASPAELKMRYMSFATGFLLIGITAGPGIQSLFSPFGEEGIELLGIKWNMYSMPTLLMIIIHHRTFENHQNQNQNKFLIKSLVSSILDLQIFNPNYLRPCARYFTTVQIRIRAISQNSVN